MKWDWTWVRVHKKPILFAVAVAALLMVIDFWVRVVVVRDDDLRRFSSPAQIKVPEMKTVEAVQDELAEWIKPPPPPVVIPPEIRLQGILGQGEGARASLALIVNGNQVIERKLVKAGETLQDWTVQSITRGGVLLKRGEEVQELVLFRAQSE